MSQTPESIEAHTLRLKRLRFRSWHRGTREMDFILGGFADRHLPELNDAQLRQFEALLEVGDNELYGWVSQEIAVPERFDTPVLALIKNFKISYPSY